jgi:hypothetical protein
LGTERESARKTARPIPGIDSEGPDRPTASSLEKREVTEERVEDSILLPVESRCTTRSSSQLFPAPVEAHIPSDPALLAATEVE